MIRVLTVWRLRCAWVGGPERDWERPAVTAVPVRREVPARQRAALPAGGVHVITDARPSRAIERS
jgi:hypothetical protein